MSGPTVGQRIVRSAYRGAARTLDVLGLKDAVRSYVLPRLISAAQGGKSASGDAAALRFVEEEVERALAAPGPIIVGPWMSEVGYELLYWIPMLRWIARKWQIPPERLVAVSRGGTAAWYAGICGGYVDLLDLMDREAFIRLTEGRSAEGRGQKQTLVERQDQATLDLVRRQAGIAGRGVFHPSLMFRAFWAGTHGRAPLSEMLERLDFARLPPPALSPEVRAVLPDRFVALRFYFRPSFPDTPEVRDFIRATVARIGERHRIVLLNTGIRLDDHSDSAVDGVIAIDHLMTPATNLAVQTEVISRASAFVGTYGGLCYLAPFLGVPSVAFYADDRHLWPVHRDLMNVASRTLGARMTCLATDEMPLIDGVLGPGA